MSDMMYLKVNAGICAPLMILTYPPSVIAGMLVNLIVPVSKLTSA